MEMAYRTPHPINQPPPQKRQAWTPISAHPQDLAQPYHNRLSTAGPTSGALTAATLRRANDLTTQNTRIERWLFDRDAGERRMAITRHAHRPNPEPVSQADSSFYMRYNHPTPFSSSTQVIGKRKTSWCGNRDQDVLDVDEPPARNTTFLLPRGPACDEVASPSSPLRHSFGALHINLVSDNERDETDDAQPARKKAKKSDSTPGSKHRKSAQNLKQAPSARPKIKQSVEATPRSVASTLPENYFFKMLSHEVRDKIYRHLLVSGKPISVSGMWKELVRSNVRRRSGRGRAEQPEEDTDTIIDARILSVNKQAAYEGSRILYSENVFIYKMRDPQSLPSRDFSTGRTIFRAGGSANSRATRSSRRGVINFAKYGHLFRHLVLELENNRTEEEYELLMACALESLVDTDAYRLDYGLAATPPWFPSGEIFLHTLSITVSPVWESSNPSAGQLVNDSTLDDSDLSHGQHLSAVKLFSSGHRIMKALKHINVNFLRVNIHVPEILTDDSDEEMEDDEETERTRHLETTIDMRYHPDQVARRPRGFSAKVWENDCLMLVKHTQMGELAEKIIKELRKRIEFACLSPDEAIRRGWWEDHAAAELRREAQRARINELFDGNRVVGTNNRQTDADTDSDSDSEFECPSGSVMINVERDPVTGQLRARRA